MSVSEFCDWIAATRISDLLRSADWIIPLVQSIHILAITAVMASALVVTLRLTGLAAHADKLTAFTHRYVPWIWRALGVLLFSGLLLVIGEPRRELLSWVFWTKMALLAGVILVTLVIQRPLAHDEMFWEARRYGAAGKALGWLSLALWVGIVVCGRWIAYTYEP